MMKKILLAILIYTFLAVPGVYASHLGPGAVCDPNKPTTDHCATGYTCKPSTTGLPGGTCESSTPADIIGKIKPPDAIKALGPGDVGISQFINSLITLIYILAVVIFVLMFLWGAIEWLTSGGNKEAVASARNRIIHAIIGIMLLAVAFAVFSLIGRFTGFNFFTTVGVKSCRDRYYPQNIDGQDECVHEYATDNHCIYVYEVVDKSLCR